MKPSSITQQKRLSNRQIGRKVLLADRLHHALNANSRTKSRFPWRLPALRPKFIALACIVVVAIGTSGFMATQFYLSKVAAEQKAAAAKQQNEQKAKSIAAEACRQKKAEQKASLIGKVTYDELYDHDACNK